MKVAATADVLDAVFAVDDSTLRVMSGQEELGSWSLADISVEQQGDGLYVNLGGEGVIVDVPDKEALIAAITGKAKQRRPRQRRKKRSDRPSNKPPSPEQSAVEPAGSAAPVSMESINQPMAQPIKRHRRDTVSLLDRLDSLRELYDRDNWDRWLNDTTVRWAIASATVIVVALMALFATNTLGMILILIGMVALIVAALAVSEDLSAYRIIPSALSETSLVIGGAAAMVIGGLLILVG